MPGWFPHALASVCTELRGRGRNNEIWESEGKGEALAPEPAQQKKGQELWRSNRKGRTDRELLSTTSETVFLLWVHTTGTNSWSTWLVWTVTVALLPSFFQLIGMCRILATLFTKSFWYNHHQWLKNKCQTNRCRWRKVIIRNNSYGNYQKTKNWIKVM